MNLPDVITRLVAAQNNFDSQAYAACFGDNAVVYDEGQTHQGKAEIEKWIGHANLKYEAIMCHLNYESNGTDAKLTAEVTGDFPGSPAVLHYHITLQNDLISSLKITG